MTLLDSEISTSGDSSPPLLCRARRSHCGQRTALQCITRAWPPIFPGTKNAARPPETSHVRISAKNRRTSVRQTSFSPASLAIHVFGLVARAPVTKRVHVRVMIVGDDRGVCTHCRTHIEKMQDRKTRKRRRVSARSRVWAAQRDGRGLNSAIKRATVLREQKQRRRRRRLAPCLRGGSATTRR